MHKLDDLNLGSGFSRYFRIDAALNASLLDEVFRVRHEVYCENLKFEPERPNRREFDDFDAHSVHCLLRTAASPHESVGCTRIILANPDDPNQPLPFERTCAGRLDHSLIDPSRLPRDRIAEISRLAVGDRYRRRKGEGNTQLGLDANDFAQNGTQPRFPFIPASLLLGAVAMAEYKGIETVFVLTEPRLATHFARLGVEVTQIGAPIFHRGLRIPSVMQVDEIIRNMRRILRPLWTIVREEIGRGFEEAGQRPRQPRS
ncbi:MAG: PEP-CTERM/exosortase system-associated acyltransferase [Thauera sp.]|nr:PEP-CTERM/exosortase system-associated acyltransferase [Thauera sp.]